MLKKQIYLSTEEASELLEILNSTSRYHRDYWIERREDELIKIISDQLQEQN
tara:strand:- start:565 stop:720 length:156 start_codon:yes stop_codon:yes gene_type:complete